MTSTSLRLCAVFLIAFCICVVITIDETDYCPRICSCPLLYRADCRSRGLRFIDDNLISDGGKKLRSLWLDHNKIRSLDMTVFEKLTNLRDLSLTYNSLKCLTRNVFSNLRNLVNLDLSNNRILYLNEGLFTQFTKLKTLNLSHNNLKDVTVELLNPLKRIEQLQLLDNPFDCANCDLRRTAEWIVRNKKKTNATCANPTGVSIDKYNFYECVHQKSIIDASECDVVDEIDVPLPGEPKPTFSLETILAISFGALLFLVIFGLIIFFCIKKYNNRSRKENEMHTYDDIKPSDYYYESIGRTDFLHPRYMSSTGSSTFVPELPQRPRKEEYDDICLRDELTSSASYIEPSCESLRMSLNKAPPSELSSEILWMSSNKDPSSEAGSELSRMSSNNAPPNEPASESLRMSSNKAPSSEAGSELSRMSSNNAPPNEPASKSLRKSSNKAPSSEPTRVESLVCSSASDAPKTLNYDYLTVKDNDDRVSSTPSIPKDKPSEFFWSRESFWNI